MVYNPGSTCILVRSIYSKVDSDNWVEIGWYKDGSSQSLDKCDDTTTPHLMVYALVNGFIKCKPGTPALSAGSSYSFRVENPAHDNSFEYFFQGSPEGSYATSFTQGLSQAFSERHTSGENLKADFSSLRFLGNAGSWNAWSSVTNGSFGDISGWLFCPVGSNAFNVRQTC